MEKTRRAKSVTARYDLESPNTDGETSETPSYGGKSARVWKKPLTISLISFGILLVGGVLSVVLYGLYGYDRIYGGVSCSGVSLSGLTRQEAVEVLNAQVLNTQYPDTSLKVYIDSTLVEFGTHNTDAHVVLGTTADQLADQAMQAGREGSFFRRVSFLLHHDEVQLDADGEGTVYIDRSLIFNTVSKITEELAQSAVPMTVNRVDDTLVFTRPRSGQTIDPAPITELIVRRMEERNFSTLTFSPTEIEPVSTSLESVREIYYEAPVNATVTGDKASGYQIQPHQNGIDVDIEPVRDWLENGSMEQGSYTVPMVAIPPELTQEKLNQLLFRNELSRVHTDFSTSTANRKSNVRLAGSLCNEAILLPGEQFSYNATVGPVNEASGYLLAGAYKNGRLVDSIGGGICQVSSTLYNAVLQADLKIVKRNNHSMTVSYLPTGLDAAVGGSSLDFVFENNRQYPIKIRMWTEKNKLYAAIVGTKDNDVTIRMDRVVIYDKPFETVTIVNPLLAPGTSVVTATGHNAVRVETFRVRLDGNGNEISRDFEARSTYRMANREIETGPDVAPAVSADPGTNATPAPTPATEPLPESEPEPMPMPEDDSLVELV